MQSHSARQRLEAMSEQLGAVTACMRSEQQARCEAEAELARVKEMLEGACRELKRVEDERDAEKVQSTSLRGLLVKLQAENKGLKETNSQLAQDCRALLGHDSYDGP